MSNVVQFPRRFHAACSSAGYRSDRSSDRGTPVNRSTAITRSGGTSFHCTTACVEIDNPRASAAGPPATLTARSNAFLFRDMPKNSSMALVKSQATLHCPVQGLLYDPAMSLGSRIKAARQRAIDGRKLTQSDIAKAFGVTMQAVSAWERDEVKPDIDKLPKLAEILLVPLEWLLAGSGAPPSATELAQLISALNGLSEAQRSLVVRQLRLTLEAMPPTKEKGRKAS